MVFIFGTHVSIKNINILISITTIQSNFYNYCTYAVKDTSIRQAQTELDDLTNNINDPHHLDEKDDTSIQQCDENVLVLEDILRRVGVLEEQISNVIDCKIIKRVST